MEHYGFCNRGFCLHASSLELRESAADRAAHAEGAAPIADDFIRAYPEDYNPNDFQCGPVPSGDLVNSNFCVLNIRDCWATAIHGLPQETVL